MADSLKEKITEHLRAALESVLGPAAAGAEIALERPKIASHGDFACNVALQLARALKRNPRDLAAAIVAALNARPAAREVIGSAEVAGPGFINLTVGAGLRQSVVRTILLEKERFGTIAPGTKGQTMVEFVSANPTGPLHVGHARQAALGDALAALLAAQGYAVTREFYYNDAGAQIDKLTLSVHARLRGLAPNEPGWPEDAYNGDYLGEIASAFLAKAEVAADDRSYVASGDPDDLDSIRQFAIAYLRHEQDLDLQAFGVTFDNHFLESSLYTSGAVEDVVQRLVAAGKTYEMDGALFLRTTEAGDDKDRVVRRSTDGSYTYFVPDVAYHLNKWRRGFVKVVNVQGTDHQSAARRVQTALQWLGAGIPEGYPEYVLHKMVKVMRDGSEVKISKRAGSYVTLRDLIDWVGRDAVRFFLVSRKADTEFTFDINLALSQSEENPVYYVQYAHARIASVFAQWRERGGADVALDAVDLSPLTSARETALLQRLAAYPEMLEQAARDIGPHQIAFYLKECAAELHSYYNAERVLVDEFDVRHARLALLAATQQVLRNGLSLLGVGAPEKM